MIRIIFLLLLSSVALRAQDRWINEIHYDNLGVDTLEFVEILLPAGHDPAEYRLWLYDGVSALPYDSASVGNWAAGDSTALYKLFTWFPQAIQNGPDAVALSHLDTLIQFISYEGTITAAGGVAIGKISVQIGVREGGDPPGVSAGLTGAGSSGPHFWWTLNAASPGTLNPGQQFTFDPILLLFSGSCLDFGQIPYGEKSLSASFTVAGANLEADITFTLPPGYEWSRESDFTGVQSSGTYVWPRTEDYYPPDTVYVRFVPGATAGQDYRDTLLVESGTAGVALCLKGEEGPFPEPNVWINELHYDNISTDVNEFVEMVIALSDSSTLPFLALHFYNGNDQLVYKTSESSAWLTGYTDPQGFLYITAVVKGIQNGLADGIALTHRGRVIQFLSYEGTLTALDGPAAGLTSSDIGVMEDTDAPLNSSLQLVGTGGSYTDFQWVYFPGAHTRNQPNHDQVLPVVIRSYGVTSRAGTWFLQWTSLEETDHSHYTVEYSAGGEDFRILDRIDPAGSLPYTYSFPCPEGLSGYLRLVQHDLNGNTTFYRPVRLRDEPAISNRPVEVLIMNIHGQVLYRERMAGRKNRTLEEVLRLVGPGVYLVRIHSADGLELHKVIKP